MEKMIDAGTQPTNDSTAPATPVPPPVNLYDSPYPLDQSHLFAPFWKSEMVYGESVVFLKESETDLVYGTLLFVSKEVFSVRSSDGKIEYIEGRDYTVDPVHGRLVLMKNSRIPVINRGDLYKGMGDAHFIPHKTGAPDVHLLHHEGWFRTIQVEVDYRRNEPWTGYVPPFAGSALPKSISKLKNGAGLKICVTGDSIATGANASNDTPPFMPGFAPLMGLGLQKAYAGTMSVTNLARGGACVGLGLELLPETVATKPDLVVIAFGMNDVNDRKPVQFARSVKSIIEGVKEVCPDTEFIIVSSMRANPEWNWSPADQFNPYRDALLSLVGPGVALADMTQLWTDVMKKKRYLDMTGNGINHPNDFGQRLYAKVLLSLLVDDAD